MILTKVGFKKRRGNSIEDVKLRLWITFSAIALSTSFLVFLAFSVYLILQEENQIEKHLVSFQDVAIKHYELQQVPMSNLSQDVKVYYGKSVLSDTIKSFKNIELNEISRDYSLADFYKNDFFHSGNVIYHFEFNFEGSTIPTYLVINPFAIDFGDDNWSALMGISMLLMIFLLIVLRFSLKRMFDGLMSPISDLSQQLANQPDDEFSISERSIDELKQLTSRLNSYKLMKERVAKQELMFAKYASHELKTPISVVLGAANLQAMKADPHFQVKQRERIIKAAEGMHDTVEVLLNIVKQENVRHKDQRFNVDLNSIELTAYSANLTGQVKLTLTVLPDTEINLPRSVLNIVLKNLLDNSIRFTQSGSIAITIGPNLIQVIDSGTGLSDQAETEHGLGLLIVERICQSYGWTFSLENTLNRPGCIAMLQR